MTNSQLKTIVDAEQLNENFDFEIVKPPQVKTGKNSLKSIKKMFNPNSFGCQLCYALGRYLVDSCSIILKIQINRDEPKSSCVGLLANI